jgi:hypothetical protein
MNCPHCQQALPEKYNASYCPHCGGAVQPTEPAIVETALKPVKIKWWVFLAVLLGPPLLTLLVAFLGKGTRDDEISPIIGLVGGGAGGIAFGIMLALRLGRTATSRVLLGMVFSVVFAVVGITMSCFGCLAGGYQLSF